MRFATAALIGLLLCTPSHASIPGWRLDVGDPSVAAIVQVDRTWSDDLQARRLDGIMAVYDENALLLVPNRPVIIGKPAIREWFAQLLATPGYTATFEPHAIEVAASRDMAYEVGAYRASLLDREGQRISSVGKHLVTWKWDGKHWRVTAEAISTDGPAGR
jgi:ketosteroid isomerase-like protein